ncbi:MAG: hypothetical protein IJE60_09570 [Tyzzerella sp.]|nr:hypothetical protein [Tyzzerella sp.]
MKKTVSKKEDMQSVNCSGDTLLGVMRELKYRKTKSELYATIDYNYRQKSVSTKCSEYYNYISRMYYEATDKFIDEGDIKKRLKIIECELQFDSNQDELYSERYVFDKGALRIDMANEQLQYIEVEDECYNILDCESDKMLFCGESIREPMEVLPMETAIEFVTGKPLDSLETYFNLSPDDLFLLKTWLVTSMNPTIYTPILFFLGGAGTGKSSMQNVIADLLDPSTRGLINWDDTPLQDLAIMLNRSYLVNFDNVSKINQRKSDLLCQCVTGGKKSYRKKYTDSDEVVYDLRTRLTISSVRNCLTQDDLLSRTLFIDVPKMSSKARIREDKFLPLYEQNRAQIMSELLIVLSIAIDRFSEWEKTHQAYNRLAGFEVFGSLVADILDEENGYERFMKIMKEKYIQQAFCEDKDWEFMRCMFDVLEEDYEGCYDGGMKKLYDITCNWIIDSPSCPYEVDIFMGYDKFAKKLHAKEELFNNLGYGIEFGRLSKENTSRVTINKCF